MRVESRRRGSVKDQKLMGNHKIWSPEAPLEVFGTLVRRLGSLVGVWRSFWDFSEVLGSFSGPRIYGGDDLGRPIGDLLGIRKAFLGSVEVPLCCPGALLAASWAVTGRVGVQTYGRR